MRVVLIVTKEMMSASIVSKIMSVGGVVREGGGDGDQTRVDSVKDYVSRRRGP